ncbi:metal-dependent hydrolase [Candidatus Berkiella aquae]|uniref:Metal-dependent hydrolase n=1 Tax=Candidatus Berkiella aquae TaxID=295108 RepID=A0A0Q9Z0J4_9GAMM|nr:metal-dependent hydrolase [Candidatus Berkiella aquae]MCS5712090.1 metal-dependent hydrolase [Candidatus Berkiella aquae]
MGYKTGTVKARLLKFNVGKNHRRYWFNDDPIKTLHANTLTASIPYGEQFFIACVLPHIKTIKDRAKRRNAIQFAQQERNHSKEHFRLFLKTVKPYYPKLKVKNNLYQKLFQVVALLVGSKIRLAMVAAMEHFTAVTGELYIREPELLSGIDEQIYLLWQWHFIEELEHKAVAFDILKTVSNNYFVRATGFFLAASFLMIGFSSAYWHMAIQDKLHTKLSFYRRSYQFFWGKSGLLRRLCWPYLRYLKPSFHPNDTVLDAEQNLLLEKLQLIEKQLEFGQGGK